MIRGRLIKAMALTAILAAAAVGAASLTPRVRKVGSLYRIQRGDVTYGFDAAWRVETLWVRAPSGLWEKLKNPPESRLEPLRRAFLSSVGKASLLEIPSEGKVELQSLKALGYL